MPCRVCYISTITIISLLVHVNLNIYSSPSVQFCGVCMLGHTVCIFGKLKVLHSVFLMLCIIISFDWQLAFLLKCVSFKFTHFDTDCVFSYQFYILTTYIDNIHLPFVSLFILKIRAYKNLITYSVPVPRYYTYVAFPIFK